MDQPTTYPQVVDALRSQYQPANLISSRRMSHLMVSANLHTFLPDLPAAEHDQFFADVLYYQALAGVDERRIAKAAELSLTGVPDSLWDAAAGKSTIFCTCHLGSYRLLGLLLTRLGINFNLLIDNQTITKQGERFLRTQREAAQYFGQPQHEMGLIDAEQASSGLQLIRTLKQGKSLVVYLDGNTGTGGVTRQDDKLVGVDFLGKPILARKGIAYLSVATQTPIVPVFAYRDSAYTNTMHVFDAVTPPAGRGTAERDQMCASLTQQLYNDFSTTLNQYPAQWEGWLYVQKYLDLPRLRATYPATKPETTAKTDWLFNHQRYANVPDGDTTVLFDKQLYRSFRITRQLGELLTGPVRPDTIQKPELMDMLISQEILR